MLLDYSYVRQYGKIWPFGAISIFHEKTIDHLDNDSIGLFLWSQELIAFGGGEHFAKIINGQIVIFDKKNKQEVQTILESSLKIVSQKIIMKVSESGYLKKISFFGEKNNPFFVDEDLNLKEIKVVHNGKKPLFYNNRAFYKVSPDLEGSNLLYLGFDYGNLKTEKIFFPENGKEVQYNIEHPLKDPLKK